MPAVPIRSLALVAIFVCACAGGTPTASTMTPPAPTADATGAATPGTATQSSATTRPTEDMTVHDGEAWVAYQWAAGMGDGIFLVRPDGTGKHRIAAAASASQFHPDWSPDGGQLAFMAVTSDDRSELWTVNADGSDARKRFACDLPCNSLSYPDWSPDGSQIFFGMDANASASAPPTTFQVGRLDVATDKVTVVLEREDGKSAEQPRVAPDGTQLAYVRFRETGETGPGSAIFVVDVADKRGSDERRLTEWSMWGAFPDWSAGGLLVFNTYDLGVFQETTEPANLYTIRPDGTDLQQLTTFGSSETRATQPRWTPDGLAILFTKVDGAGFGQRRIGSVAADGSDLHVLNELFSATHPSLRPLD